MKRGKEMQEQRGIRSLLAGMRDRLSRPMLLSMMASMVLLAGMSQPGHGADGAAHTPKKAFPAVALAKKLRGEEAVTALGGKLAEVAAWYGMTPQAFASMLRQDRHAWLDRQGRLNYVDDFGPPPEQAEGATGGTAAAASLPSLDQTFKLHSRPGASRVIYLDFDGHALSNSAWNQSYGLAAIDGKPFDTDGNPGGFSSAELERIQYIWQRVAEDYAPFDVDVTTEEPLPDAMARSGSGDTTFGMRVVITKDWTALTASPCGCGGFAYVGVFDDTSEYYKPAWVFYDRLAGGNEKYVAEAISHESGHTLGLSHDGSSTTSYYQGHGSGATGWAPIMGVGYYKELVQWSKGEYPNANQFQDDLQLIQSYGAPLRADDHGGSIATATALDVESAGGVSSLSGSGVIGNRADLDVFRFDAGAGAINLQVDPAPRSPNLDVSATLLDAAGNILATSNPAEALNASISLPVMPAGTYYLLIDGTGKGDLTTGYSDYASLGEYFITGTVSAPLGSPPVAVASATSTSGSVPLTVSFSSSGSYDPDGGTLAYDWDFGDGSAHAGEANPAHVYTAAGTYNASLTVTDASGSQDSAQLTITVQAPPPALHVASIAMSASTKRTGTRATATVTIVDAAGQAMAGATVTGSWSGAVSGTASGVTTSKGSVKFTSANSKTGGTFTFTVTGVSLSGYQYDAAQNAETSDSITR